MASSTQGLPSAELWASHNKMVMEPLDTNDPEVRALSWLLPSCFIHLPASCGDADLLEPGSKAELLEPIHPLCPLCDWLGSAIPRRDCVSLLQHLSRPLSKPCPLWGCIPYGEASTSPCKASMGEAISLLSQRCTASSRRRSSGRGWGWS